MMRAACLVIAAACCPAPPDVPPSVPAPLPSSPPSLTFVDDYNFATGTIYEDLRLGGISALSWDPDRERLLALSDAHREHAPARMYELDVRVDDRELSARLTGMTLLTGPFSSGTLDPEGMTRVAPGLWVVSTEGDGEVTPRLPPMLYRVKADGTVLSEHALPDAFTPTPEGPLTHGLRHNKGFEGLTASPAGDVLFAINEAPVVQDGEPATFEHGARLRLLKMNAQLEVVSEHRYLTEPVPRLADENVQKAQNGVSALCALDDTVVLVMERAAVKADGKYQNRIQIYEVRIGVERELDKRLVLDLDDVVHAFEEGARRLDNFEAMALGPVLPSGARSLILGTDDNFKDEQRTVLLAFALHLH